MNEDLYIEWMDNNFLDLVEDFLEQHQLKAKFEEYAMQEYNDKLADAAEYAREYQRDREMEEMIRND